MADRAGAVELRAAVGNVRRAIPAGPGGEQERNGTRHFRGGAKVFVIDAFWGTCDSVTVVGQHRKSRRYLRLHMRAGALENLRVGLVYRPAVLAPIREHHAEVGRDAPPGKESAEQLCHSIPLWREPDGPR